MPCPHTPCSAFSISGLATYPIPRVLFSAGEGKRCWLLSRDASVDVRDPRYCLLIPASSRGEKGLGSKGGGLRAPGNGPLETSTLSSPSPSAQETPGSDQPRALPSGRGKGHLTPLRSHLTVPIHPTAQIFYHPSSCLCPSSQAAELGSFLTPFSTLCFMSRTFLH